MTTPNYNRICYEAALLDTILPGWARFINTNTLSMTHTNTCVCGQLRLHPKLRRKMAAKSNYLFYTLYKLSLLTNFTRYRSQWILAINDRLQTTNHQGDHATL